ncbi:LysR family transcriptional regulator [Nevskia sp.]|uniref:LysR family transcriptional regulator n=1 Tax=Nevskia sp. TaxID=1929292 RepID=UPI003F6EE412
MDLHQIDLNLLVVFRQLMAERRVSRAAESLGLTQPAVSNALGRLRRLLGDELFRRTSRGMEPTPFAEALAEPVANALSLLHRAVNQRAAFDPATADRAFTIGMTDIGEIYFLPALMEMLSREAPQLTISTVRNTAINLRDAMEAGQVDLAIGLLPQLKAAFFQRPLFSQRYVCLMRRDHPLSRAPLTLDAFAAAEHVVVMSAGTGHGRVDALLDRQKIARRVRLRVPHFVAVGHILAASDMIATVPARFAETVTAPFGLVALPHPATLPDIAINLFWHTRQHQDPGNRWLRERLLQLHADPAAVRA